MTRSTILVALALAAVSATAQPFPAPGTGVFTWERVGDRPRNFESFSFAPGGRLFAARDTVFTFDPATEGAPAGRWRAVGYNGGLPDALLALDPDGDTLLTGHGGSTRRSTNAGATWAVVNGSLSGTVAGGPDAPDGFFVVPPGHTNAGRLFAGGVVIYSDDRGATWTDAGQDIPTGSQSFARTFAVLPSGRVLAGTGGGVLASDNGGESYTRTPHWGPYVTDALVSLATPGSRQAGVPSCGLPDGALCDGAVAVGYSSQLPHVRAWRTADGGRTWSASVALPEPQDGVANGYTAGVVVLAPGADGLGRAITVLGRGVVYATADGAQTWRVVGRLPTGDASHYTRLMRLGPDGHLWVSTARNGTVREWMYRSAEAAEAAFPVASETQPEAPSEIGVSVRPNPAPGRVEVSVTGAASARVVVLDALGREVARAEAAGGVARLDTRGWPAGVYVVRAEASGRVGSARLVVAR